MSDKPILYGDRKEWITPVSERTDEQLVRTIAEWMKLDGKLVSYFNPTNPSHTASRSVMLQKLGPRRSCEAVVMWIEAKEANDDR